MRILHVYKDYDPALGGIENHVRLLAAAQVDSGHSVTVLVCGRGLATRREVRSGVQIVRAGCLGSLRSMPISLVQPFLLAKHRGDIVHVHSPYPLGELAAWLLRGPTKLVITHHSDVVRQKFWLQFYGPLLRRVLQQADRILATSARYVETSAWLNPIRRNCTVVPLGVDTEHFRPGDPAGRADLSLLFVGRLRYYKGLDTLILALKELQGVSLKIVGDGPMRSRWEALSSSLDLMDRVEFVGDLDDVQLLQMYQSSSLFVLPANARSEAFGTVLLEAMACGLPCVTTEIGTATSWLVQHGVTGLVVPPDDAAALRCALRRLLKNPDRLKEMSEAARRRVEENFGWQPMFENVMRVYAQLERADS